MLLMQLRWAMRHGAFEYGCPSAASFIVFAMQTHQQMLLASTSPATASVPGGEACYVCLHTQP